MEMRQQSAIYCEAIQCILNENDACTLPEHVPYTESWVYDLIDKTMYLFNDAHKSEMFSRHHIGWRIIEERTSLTSRAHSVAYEPIL